MPNAQANLAEIPDELTDEQVVLLAHIASTGFSGAEWANIRIGDSVVADVVLNQNELNVPKEVKRCVQGAKSACAD